MSNNLAENLFIVTAPSGAGKTTLIKNESVELKSLIEMVKEHAQNVE